MSLPLRYRQPWTCLRRRFTSKSTVSLVDLVLTSLAQGLNIAMNVGFVPRPNDRESDSTNQASLFFRLNCFTSTENKVSSAKTKMKKVNSELSHTSVHDCCSPFGVCPMSPL